jgi:hypothetical protein
MADPGSSSTVVPAPIQSVSSEATTAPNQQVEHAATSLSSYFTQSQFAVALIIQKLKPDGLSTSGTTIPQRQYHADNPKRTVSSSKRTYRSIAQTLLAIIVTLTATSSGRISTQGFTKRKRLWKIRSIVWRKCNGLKVWRQFQITKMQRTPTIKDSAKNRLKS